eukprot:RCo012934
MEAVLQRCISNLQKEHEHTVGQFRAELQRLQQKCSEYQEELALEKVKQTHSLASELCDLCRQHSANGLVRVDLIERFLQRKLVPHSSGSSFAPRPAPGSLKRSREDSASELQEDGAPELVADGHAY